MEYSTQTQDWFLGLKTFFPKKPNFISHSSSQKAFAPQNHIVGRFQHLKNLFHPHLCRYIDIILGYHDRIIVVSEHFPLTLRNELERRLRQQRLFDEMELKRLAFTILSALVYLNQQNIVHRNLSLDNVLFDSKGCIKLSDYGLYYMTDAGANVPFPIGNPHFLAPESIARGIAFSTCSTTTTMSLCFGDSAKVDVWSLGILLVWLILGHSPWTSPPSADARSSPTQVTSQSAGEVYEVFLRILQFVGHDLTLSLELSKFHELERSDIELIKQKESSIGGILFATTKRINEEKPKFSFEERDKRHKELAAKRETILQQWFSSKQFENISSELKEIISYCLVADPIARVTPEELLHHPYFEDMTEPQTNNKSSFWAVKPYLRCAFVDTSISLSVATTDRSSVFSSVHTSNNNSQNKPESTNDGNDSEDNNFSSLEELFFVWKMCGGDVERDLLRDNDTVPPPILRLPHIIRVKEEEHNISTLLQGVSVDESLRYSEQIICVSIDKLKEKFVTSQVNKLKNEVNQLDNRTLEEKECDVEYQRKRLRLFRQLIAHYPETRSQILAEAQKDIPPVLRGEIWALILGVTDTDEHKKLYEMIDKDSETASDSQIALDVPRCHQYNPALSSPEGQRKLFTILKAWVRYNPHLVYWQGIDSLLAPFLVLNFTNESKAFWCLQAVVEKFLSNFFTRDQNTSYLQERLILFQQLLAYHDPELAIHLYDIKFKPELYTISWFLTLFAHILSLDEIFKVWDVLLISPPVMPLFIAVAILKQFRTSLLKFDFNQCILFFSNFPSFNISLCLKEAKETFDNTPPSVTMQHHTNTDSTSNSSLRWWEKRISVEELSTYLTPRISVSDVVSSSFHYTILDVRNHQDFTSVHYPQSIHIPSMKKKDVITKLEQLKRTTHFVVVGDRSQSAIHFANELVRCGIPQISVLCGGIEALIAEANDLLLYAPP
jgi:serine/threonine protein kinase/rhodanese-related sulfurtransferase